MATELRFFWRLIDVAQSGCVPVYAAILRLTATPLGGVSARWARQINRTPTVRDGLHQSIVVWDFVAQAVRDANARLPREARITFTIPDVALKEFPQLTVMIP